MDLEQRTTVSTNMNSESSRSHSVFTITIRFQNTLSNEKVIILLEISFLILFVQFKLFIYLI